MKLRAAIEFWEEGVCCFCHEALGRAVVQAFPGARIGESDLALRKYEGAAADPRLEGSAWNEYLRNGPLYSIELESGTYGAFSRYEIAFELSDTTSPAEVEEIRSFLASLHAGPILIED